MINFIFKPSPTEYQQSVMRERERVRERYFTLLSYSDVKVGSETRLRCEGDGNPEPEYEWQQKIEDGDTSMVLVRMRDPVLYIR